MFTLCLSSKQNSRRTYCFSRTSLARSSCTFFRTRFVVFNSLINRCSDEAVEILTHISLVCTGGHGAQDIPQLSTTTYSHTRHMVKDLLQDFKNAHLIAYANDSRSKSVKEQSIFVPTEKGLHIVEQYIFRQGILDDNFRRYASTQIVCPRLMHLDRDAEDMMILPNDAIHSIFRWFSEHKAGHHHGHTSVDALETPNLHGHPDIPAWVSRIEGQGNREHPKYHFSVVTALDWLCNFTSVRGCDDAAIIFAHFERCGLIRMVSNATKRKDPSIIFHVRGPSSQQNSYISVSFHDFATATSRSNVEFRSKAYLSARRERSMGSRKRDVELLVGSDTLVALVRTFQVTCPEHHLLINSQL